MVKKGQISIFIIIGVILLIAVVSYFILINVITEPEEAVVSEIQPVKTYVERCIYDIALEGLETQGRLGGFIEIPENIEYNRRAYMQNDLFGNIQHPFWFYDGIVNKPTLEDANAQLTRYVTDNFLQCVNFTGFPDAVVTPLLEEPVVQVIYAQDDTVVNVDYPLIIETNGDVNRDVTEFQVNVPIRFKKVFETAEAIMQSELDTLFLEKKVIDMIAMTPEDEIPYTGIEFDCARKSWSMVEIQERLKELINVNFPYIKFANLPYNENKYVPVPDKPNTYENSYFNLHYVWDAGIERDNNIKAAVYFDQAFPFSIYANPSDGKKLRSNSQQAQGIASFVCLNIWHFTYDVSFPVIIRVKDPAEKTRPDYVFEYATRVMINHNQPDHENVGTVVYDQGPSADTEEYCQTDFSDQEITVFAINKDTFAEIPGAEIEFVCGFMSCPMGETDYIPNLGNRPGITARAPQCVNAVLKANKEGYLEGKYFGDVNTEYPGTYFIEMDKVMDIKEIEVVKHMMEGETISQQETALSSQETAGIMITAEDYPDYQEFVTYPVLNFEDEDFELLQLFEDKDITYHVTIFVNRGDRITAGYEADWEPAESGDKIKFHTVGMETEDDYENFLFMQGIESYSKQVSAPEIQ